MKTIFILSITLFALQAEAKMGLTGKVKYAGDLNYSDFCDAVVNDDVDVLKHSVSRKVGVVASSKREVMKKLIATDGMTCNGLDLITFAQQRNATEVSKYFANIQ